MSANNKLKSRILIGYSIPIVFFLVFSTLVYFNNAQTQEIFKKVSASQNLLLETDDMILRIALMGRQIRGYLLVGNSENSLDNFNIEEKNYLASAERANNLIENTTTQQKERYKKMVDLANQFRDVARQTVRLRDANKQEEAVNLSLRQSKPIVRGLDSLNQEFRQEEVGNFKKNIETTTNNLDLINKATLIIPIISLAIAITVGYLIATIIEKLTSLISEVQKSGIQVTTSTTQIAASGKQLEATINEQVASTNEVAVTAKEIAATSSQLVKTMDEVQYTSQATAQAAGESQKDLIHMEKTMRILANSTGNISSKLAQISEKSHNINSIITTITKVADQTNLLSLNAAIEAEKAGEYGTGFAVVAREIRRLADQTAVATLDIENMVKEMQTSVSAGVMEMDGFTKEVERGVEDVGNISTKLESIIEQVQTLTPQFEKVSGSMEAQSEGAQQISEAMVQLSETSSQTVQSLREVNGAIRQLNEVAQSLRQEVSDFKVS